jgi:hypothetical protein
MRARWVKPEFFRDRKIAAMGPIVALVYEALWVISDDYGTAPCDPDRLNGELFYAWSEVGVPEITGALRKLDGAGRITRFRVGDDTYCRIKSWAKHQNVHKASQFRYPTEGEPLIEDSAEIPGTSSESSGTPHHLDSKTPRLLDTKTPKRNTQLRTSSGSTPDEVRQSGNSATGTGSNSEIADVLDHYQQTHPRRKVGDEKQRKLVGKALKLGFTVEDLKHAITGNADDPWHQERRKHELGYVLRDADHINGFLEKYEQQQAPIEGDFFP